jgi:DNA invertase Pin-like site-specific DNA recombinase
MLGIIAGFALDGSRWGCRFAGLQSEGRDQRSVLDAMLKAVNAKEFDMVTTWSMDRLGRSLTDLLGILQGLHEGQLGLGLLAPRTAVPGADAHGLYLAYISLPRSLNGAT